MKARANHVTLVRDASALAERACSEVIVCANAAIAARGAFHVAVSAGAMARATCQRLSRAGWTTSFALWHVWFADEHSVAAEHGDSRFRRVRDALLDHVEIPRANVHRMRGEQPDNDTAAREYESELVSALGPSPQLDLALLDLGEDGHVASLIPGSTAMNERELWVTGVPEPRRITLTVRTLENARRVWFLASGTRKAVALQAALTGDPAAPAAAFAPEHVHWFADRAAAAKLEPHWD